jgi:dipeptidase D
MLENLNPSQLWKHFEAISSIPHGSGNEKKLAEYIVEYAKSRKLECSKDKFGNVRVEIPASKSKENSPSIALQAHLDMVCEKNEDTAHDFLIQPLNLFIEKGWLGARGTTLGADNGIGVATALALIDSPEISHGPLELIFTTEEETGLTGALNLGADFIKSRRLVNLDTEDLGVICIGCAGGSRTDIRFPLEFTACQDPAVKAVLRVTGLKGGHSGLDINSNRSNALKILAGLLSGIKNDSWKLASINGGTKSNTIPREACAELVISGKSDVDRVKAALENAAETVKKQMAVHEPDAEISIGIQNSASPKAMSNNCRDRLLKLLIDVPHGVASMSDSIPNLVQTSNNLAIVSTSANSVNIQTMSRSSKDSEQADMEQTIIACATAVKAKAEVVESYPGWEPDLKSNLLSLTAKAYKKVIKQDPKIEAVHAGLECGIIGKKYKGMETVSIGPTIKWPHSPAEKVDVKSVEVFWEVLTELIN